MALAKTLPKDKVVLVTISGRGDKDMEQVARILRVDLGDSEQVVHRGQEEGGVGAAAAAAATTAAPTAEA